MQGEVVKDSNDQKEFHLLGVYVNSGILEATY